MAKSYFAILEITSKATPDEVQSAYRRLAKAYHPDHYGGGRETFQQIQEAYSILADPAKRRAYEKNLSKLRFRKTRPFSAQPEPEPLVPDNGPVDLGEISPVRSFETFSPSFDEIFDWLWRNFSSIAPPKSGKVENLTLEVPLTREQALRGGSAVVMAPARSVCPDCGGYGRIGYYDCPDALVRGRFQARPPFPYRFRRA